MQQEIKIPSAMAGPENTSGRAMTLHHEGENLAKEGKCREAVASLEKAVEANPALLPAWEALYDLYGTQGKSGLRQRAAQRVEFLRRLPEPLRGVALNLYEGKIQKAEEQCRRYLQSNPRHIEGMRLLAEIGIRVGVLDDAEFLLESCLAFDPRHRAARYDYVRVLHKRQKFASARSETEKLLADEPDNLLYKTMHAAASLAVGEYESALSTYQEIIESDPKDHRVRLYYGHALKTVGRTGEAIDSYRTAYQLRPDFGDAWWSLANLKTYQFDEKEMRLMAEQEDLESIALKDRYHLCFALGKGFEHRNDYASSFEYYDRGNRLKHSELRYKPERIEKEFAEQIRIVNRELISRTEGFGFDSPSPIFIVGLPRAGSTLIEQILASHPEVDGTLELPNILAMSNRLNGRQKVGEPGKYPEILSTLPEQVFEKLGRSYIEETQVFREGAPYFTDKMPNNFRHIGLIHLILPRAKIIDARREPVSSCFSAFKQLFAEGQEFTYDLREIGHYYRHYVELMNHWNAVLPGKVLQVNYEDVVADLESQVRRILDYCGLPFDERCLNFHETRRAVKTASSEQVRRPIYTDSLKEWKKFEPFLGTLLAELG